MSISDYIAVFGIMSVFVASFITGWIKMSIKLAVQNTQIINLSNRHEDFEKTVDKIYDELKEINEKVSNKADRP